MPIQTRYVTPPDVIDFIAYTGSNEAEIVAAITAITGEGTVTYIKPAGHPAVWLLVVNNQSATQPYMVYTLGPQEAVRLNGDTGGVGLLPISIIDTPGELVAYNSVYTTPPA